MSNNKNYDSQSNVSILEAVETLADIGELNFKKEVSVAKRDEINEQNRQVSALAAKKLHLDSEDPDTTVKAIRETFHVVLDYIRNYYKNETTISGQEKSAEGVKTIMVIVGEAVQHLDKYTTLFKNTREKDVAHLKEYKQLQDFYLTHVARRIDQGVLGKWVLELAKGAIAKHEKVAREELTTTETKHVFIDLDVVRKDTEYELFFMKKEDGTRFFSPRLIRNIKLVCDFERRIGRESIVDPFQCLPSWHDEFAFETAKNIIHSLGGLCDRFYRDTKQNSRWDIVLYVNKAIMALLLSANTKNKLRFAPSKTCFEYFNDFLGFLRAAMATREYQKWIVYPPKHTNRVANTVLDTIHGICSGLIVSNQSSAEIIEALHRIIQGAEKSGETSRSHYIWGHLLDAHLKLTKLIKNHPNGPLVKVLEIMKQGGYPAFDPLAQYNIPQQLFSVFTNETRMTNVRIPSPTIQQYIHSASVAEEFKGMLRQYESSGRKKKHLLINFQDRTSWSEHFRSIALEELQNHPEFKNALVVVTLSKDTEFYEQLPPYDKDNHADSFIKNFKRQLQDENCGFYFPPSVKKEIFPKFVNGVMAAIHKVFFAEKNVLTVSNRKNFIEIFYLFLELKLLDIVHPETFSLTCKDGVDTGEAANVLLYLFLHILHNNSHTEEDLKKVNGMLYIPSLLIRERIIQPNRFDRMLEALKHIEFVKEEWGLSNFEGLVKESFEVYLFVEMRF